MAHIVDQIETKEEETGSEAEVLTDILAGSKDCPEWQRDALCRVSIKGEMDGANLDELTVPCKSKGKGGVTLTADHIPNSDAATTADDLRAIHGAESVNGLKPGEHFTL